MAKSQKQNGVESVEAPAVEAPAAITLRRNQSENRTTGGGGVFEVPGRRGLVYVPATFFVDGKIPETITLGGFALAPASVPAAKLTPEERKAAAEARKAELAKLSPAEKAKLAAEKAAETARKAAERAAKLAAAVPTEVPQA